MPGRAAGKSETGREETRASRLQSERPGHLRSCRGHRVDRSGRKLCANARRRCRASVARDHRWNGNTIAVRPVHSHQPLGDCEHGPHQGTAADVLWRLRGHSPQRRALEHEPQLSRSAGKIARTPPLSREYATSGLVVKQARAAKTSKSNLVVRYVIEKSLENELPGISFRDSLFGRVAYLGCRSGI